MIIQDEMLRAAIARTLQIEEVFLCKLFQILIFWGII